MPKDKLTRKDLLKGPDEFLTLSERAFFFIRDHSRPFRYLGMAVAGAAVVYVIITTYFGYINRKGQEAYNTAYYALPQNIKSEKEQESLKQSAELFQKVIENYGQSKVSKLAIPEMAYLKFLGNTPDEAISFYERFLGNVGANNQYQSLVRLALAACYEEKKDFEKAISVLRPIVEGPEPYFKDHAMLGLSRVYRLSNQEEKSKEVLKALVETYQTSTFLPIAKAYLNNTL